MITRNSGGHHNTWIVHENVCTKTKVFSGSREKQLKHISYIVLLKF
jgi:hypothetical protein